MIRMDEHLPAEGDRTVLIFEWVSGGGLVGQALPPSLASEGAAIRRTLVADFAALADVRVVEPVDARCLAGPPPRDRVRRIIVDPARPIDLDSLAAGCDHTILIAPETDGILHGLARQVAAVGGHSLGSTAAAIALCADKLRLADHLRRVGVPTPPTWAFRPADGWPRVGSASGRVVVKPVDGAGSVATFVVPESSPCPAALRAYPLALVQPFRPGTAASAGWLVGHDGRAHNQGACRQTIETDGAGQVHYRGGEVLLPFAGDGLEPVRQAVESVPGLGGFVGVDFVLDEATGAVEVIEINPRPTTSIVGLVHCGPPGKIARAWLGCMADRPGWTEGEAWFGNGRGDWSCVREDGGQPLDIKPAMLTDDPLTTHLLLSGRIRFRADGSFILDEEINP